MSIGDRMYTMKKIKEKRKKRGFTIHDMAAKLSISPSYYWQLENNRKRLFYDMAVRMAALFNVKPDSLFYEKNKD